MENSKMISGRFLKKQTGKRKFAAIVKTISDGGKVYVCTAYKQIAVSKPEHIRLSVSGSLYVARGKSWDCIDYCALQFSK